MFGSGGVGGYYGARLAQSGQEVTFIARGAHGRLMREKGLRIKSEVGDALIQPVRVIEDPAQAGVQDRPEVVSYGLPRRLQRGVME